MFGVLAKLNNLVRSLEVKKRVASALTISSWILSHVQLYLDGTGVRRLADLNVRESEFVVVVGFTS